jgi:hypothetical protein
MTDDDAPKAPPFDWGDSGDDSLDDGHQSDGPDENTDSNEESFGLDEYSSGDNADEDSPFVEAVREREANEDASESEEDGTEEYDADQMATSVSASFDEQSDSVTSSEDDEFIPSPDGPSGPRRKVNIRRVGAVAAVLLVGSVVLVAVLFAGLPSVPAFGACDEGAPTVGFATFQTTDQSGETVAFQLTNSTDVQYVHVVSETKVVGNMTTRGSVVTVNGLSSGETIEYVGFHECGSDTLGTYTVR